MKSLRLAFVLVLVLTALGPPTRVQAGRVDADTPSRVAEYVVLGVGPITVDDIPIGRSLTPDFGTSFQARLVRDLRSRGMFRDVIDLRELPGPDLRRARSSRTVAATVDSALRVARDSAMAARVLPAGESRLIVDGTIYSFDKSSTLGRMFGHKLWIRAWYTFTDARTGEEVLRLEEQGNSGEPREMAALAQAFSVLARNTVHDLGAELQASEERLRPTRPGRAAGGWQRPSAFGPWRGFVGGSGIAHALVSSEMNQKYAGLGGARFDYTFWFHPDWAVKADISFMGTGGAAVEVIDPRVRVEHNSMSVLSVPILIEVLHRWRPGQWSRSIGGYYGLGFGLVESDETIELRAVEASLDTIDVRTEAAFYGFVVSAVAGYQLHMVDRLHGFAEVRWMQAGPGRFADLGTPKTPEEKLVASEFTQMIHRPNYNVSGWGATLGFRWGR